MDFLIKFIYSFILACSLLYIWHKLIDKKINFRNYILYVTLMGITLISIFKVNGEETSFVKQIKIPKLLISVIWEFAKMWILEFMK